MLLIKPNLVTPRSPLINDHVLENTVYRGMCSLGYRFNSLAKPINRLAADFLPRAHYSDESFKVFPSSRKVKFSEMEFSVPQEQGPACFYEIKRLIEKEGLRIFFPIEYRYVAADDIPLSPFFGRASVAISLHTYRGLDQKAYFTAAQKIFLKYKGRPHWGKIHTLKHFDLRLMYEDFHRFTKCRRDLDPKGSFLTPYLKTLFISNARLQPANLVKVRAKDFLAAPL
jgi:FAD/FMN-containing dehydrogenase